LLKTITFSLFVNELLLTIHDQISVFFWRGRWVNGQLYHAAWYWSKFFKLILCLVIFFPFFTCNNRVFFSPVNSFYSIVTPSFFHYYLQIWPLSWMRDWRSRVFSQRSKTSPGWGCSLILLWPLLIFLPPQCLLCFQAYLPLTFWITLLDAFYQSLVCFFVPYYVSPCSLKGFVVNE